MEVLTRSGYGSIMRAADRTAEERNRTDWPRLMDGETGTQVHVTFDARNADIVLFAPKDLTIQTLHAEARRIASALRLPKSDYILYTGRRTVMADVEMNDYLVRNGRRTEFELDLAALTQALRRSETLPKPIVVTVDLADSDRVSVLSDAGESPLNGNAAFYGLDEAPTGARLRFESTIPIASYPLAIFMVGVFLGTPVLFMLMPWIVARKRAELAARVEDPEPPSPEEVQRAYRKLPPAWLMTAGIPMAMIGLAIFGNVERVMRGAMLLIPMPDSFALILVPALWAVPFAVSWAVCKVVYARRRAAGLDPVPRTELAGDDPSRMLRPLLPMMAAMFLLLLLISIPAFSRSEWYVRIPTIFVVLSAAFASSAVLAIRNADRSREVLGAESPWRVMVEDLAKVAGVRVKQVVVVKSKLPNAYASVLGTVGLTEGLISRLDQDELRTVIAHELGHLRFGHTKRTLAVSIIFLVTFLTAWWYTQPLLKGRISDFALALLQGPLVGAFLLPILMGLVIGPMRRRFELEADRFAASVVGDVEVVIRALSKIHTLSAEPHELKRSDEAIAAHPSLVHRIAALRAGNAGADALTGMK